MDTQQSCAAALSNNSSTLSPLSSLSLVLSICCFLSLSLCVCVGLIEAFRHRIKASGSVPQRSQLEALCPNAKEKLKQSSSKQPSSKRGGVFRLQHQRVSAFYPEIKKLSCKYGTKLEGQQLSQSYLCLMRNLVLAKDCYMMIYFSLFYSHRTSLNTVAAQYW